MQRYLANQFQHQLWLACRTHPELPLFNIAFCYEIKGQVSVHKLKAAIQKITINHTALRTGFSFENGTLYQIVSKDIPLDYKFINLTKSENINEQFNRISRETYETTFDLSNPGLARYRLIKLSETHYKLLLVWHHLAIDAYSVKALLMELNHYYSEQKIEHKLQTDTTVLLPIEGTSEQDLNYWKNLLRDTDLTPIFDRKCLIQAGKAKRKRIYFDDSVTQKVMQYIKHSHCTLFEFISAAVNALAYRYSGKNDLVIGYVTNHRIISKRFDEIGFQVNKLPLRINIDGSEAFSSLVSKVTARRKADRNNQKIFYKDILEIIRAKSPNATDIFDIVVNQYTYLLNDLSLSGCEVQQNPVDTVHTTTPLTILFDNINGKLVLEFEYQLQCYDQATIIGISEGLKTLIETVIKNTEICIKNLPLEGPTTKKLLAQLNNTHKELPDYDIAQLISNTCKRYHDQIAIVDGPIRISFHEVNRQSNYLAKKLREHAVKENDIIPIITDRSWKYIIAAIAVLKCGAGFLPTKIDTPLANIDSMLSKLSLKVSINCTELPLPEQFKSLKVIDYQHLQLDFPNGITNDNYYFSPSSAAYVIPTSGTTGEPKYVINTRLGILNRLMWMQNDLQILLSDAICFKTPITFDVSIWEVLLTFITGATVIIVAPGKHIDISYVCDMIQEFQITIVHFVPSLFNQFLHHSEFKHCKSLRHIICSGESLHQNLVEKFYRLFSPKLVTLHNYYGPAEAAIDVTAYICKPKQKYNAVPIGTYFDNIQIEVLDANGQRVPLGGKGELCIAGVGLAQGYLGIQDSPAFRFHYHFKKRFYHTGDLASLSHQGVLEFHGRMDRQIKLHGQRLEIDALEMKLSELTNIKNSCVIYEKSFNKQLITFYVSNNGLPIGKESFEEHLLKYFPRSVLPNQYVLLPELPLSQNGKVDKNALRAYFTTNHQPDQLAQSSEMTKILATIWCQLLNVSDVTAHSHFFALGGDSLKVIELSVILYNQLGLSIGADQLLNHLSFDKFCELVTKTKHTYSVLDSSAKPLKDFYPLSEQQFQVWQACQKDLNSCVYHIPLLFDAIKQLDFKHLVTAANTLLDRYKWLKIRFKEIDGRPYQKIVDDRRLSIDFIKVTPDQLLQYTNKPFDLENDLLLRCYVNQHNKRYQILWVFHHLIIDEWSLQIFFEEFNVLYTNSSAQLPNPIDCRDYLNTLTRDIYHRIATSTPDDITNIPFDHSQAYTFWGSTLHSSLPEATTTKIAQICRELKISKFSFLLSTFTLLLSRLTNNQQIAINTTIANRTRPEIARLIGFIAKTIMIKSDVNENQTLSAFLSNNSKELQIQLADPVIRSLNICFAYLNQQDLHMEFNGQQVKPALVHTDTSKFELTLYAYDNAGIMKFALEYNKSHYKEDSVQTILNSYIYLIELLSQANFNDHILKLYPYTDVVQARSLINSALPNNLVSALVLMVEQNNLENKIALCDPLRELTYGQLLEQASCLVSTLKNRIFPGDYVAFLQADNINAIICMLGIVMAGAVYIPLSYQMPEERRNLIIETAKCKILVVDSYLKEKVDIHQILFHETLQTPVLKPHCFAPSDLAYILFTSGTTGIPKGVKVSHQNVLHLIEQSKHLLNLTNNERWSLCHSVTFDYATWEIWGALLTGATLVIPLNEYLKEPEKLIQWFQSQAVSIFSQTPTSLQQILQFDDFKNWVASSVLRYIILGGEKFYPHILESYWPALELAGTQVLNMYGITECTVHSTYHAINAKDIDENLTSPIGKALPGMGIFLLDRYHRIAAPMHIGEICIFGQGVSQGYLANINSIDTRFYNHEVHGKKYYIYRTGDQAIWRDEILCYLSRADRQVKIRGHRIELAEIELYLKGIPDIIDAFVFQTDFEKRQLLIAVLNGKPRENSEIYQTLAKFLPDYMVPHHFIFLEKIPKTINGKLDTHAILKYLKLDKQSIYSVDQPNSKNSIILSVWRKILNNDKLDIDDNFFYHGGDSIAVMQVVSLLRQKNIQVQVKDIYQHQTVRSLATVAPEIRESQLNKIPEQLPLQPIARWFFDHINTNVNHWSQFISLQIEKNRITIKEIEIFADYLWQRHGILRYLVDRSQQNWRLTNTKEQLICISELPGIYNITDLKPLIQQLAGQINIGRGPVMHLVLVNTNNKQILIWIAHHLYVDGVSWRYLQDDFNNFLENKLLNSNRKMDDAFCQWAKDVENKNTWSQWQIQRDYWKKFITVPQPFEFSKQAQNITYRSMKTRSLLLTKAKTIKIQKFSNLSGLSIDSDIVKYYS